MIPDFNNYDIIIFEGYEHVGKTYLMDKLQTRELRFRDITRHSPEYCKKYGITHSDMYKVGLIAIRIALHTMDIAFKHMDNYSMYSPLLYLDRSLASTIVYNTLSNQKEVIDIDKLIEQYKEVFRGRKVLIVHVSHYNTESMDELLKASISKPDDYDKFADFNDYARKYCKFESAFDDAYKLMKSKGMDFDIVYALNEYGGDVKYDSYQI